MKGMRVIDSEGGRRRYWGSEMGSGIRGLGIREDKDSARDYGQGRKRGGG